MKEYNIVLITITLIVLFVLGLFPRNYLFPNIPSGNYNNCTCFDCNVAPDYLILNLIWIFIPIIAIVGIVIVFYPSKESKS